MLPSGPVPLGSFLFPHMDRKHAFASASSSSLWLACPAAPGFIDSNSDKLPPDSDSKYSLEGTEAHDYAAHALEHGYDASRFKDKAMAVHVKGYYDVVKGWADLPGAELFIETPVPLFYAPHEDGYLDAGVVTADNRVFIGDLKYGEWMSVEAKGNTQLIIYALSFIEMLSSLYTFNDKTLVCLLIYQPRVEGERPVRMWALSLPELKQAGAEILRVGTSIYANPHAQKFNPSDKTCRWCPAASICGKRAAQLFSALPDDAVVVKKSPQFPDPHCLTEKQLANIVRIAPAFRDWLKQCEATGHHRLSSGQSLEGFKLVAGRSIRKWVDDLEAAMLLTELGLEPYGEAKVLSPAQAEELLSVDDRKRLQKLIVKPQGAPTVVPESDSRPAFRQNPADIFADLTQEPGLDQSQQELLGNVNSDFLLG